MITLENVRWMNKSLTTCKAFVKVNEQSFYLFCLIQGDNDDEVTVDQIKLRSEDSNEEANDGFIDELKKNMPALVAFVIKSRIRLMKNAIRTSNRVASGA